MKLIMIFMVIFCGRTQAGALENDLKLVHESVKRINQLLVYYDTDVSPLVEQYLADPNTIFNKIEKSRIDHFWTQLIDYRIVLHTLYNTYSESDSSYQAILLRYSSNLSLQVSAGILSLKLWKNSQGRHKFNETNLSQIPRGSFMSLENELFSNFNNHLVGTLPTLFPSYSLKQDQEKIKALKHSSSTDIEIELEAMNAGGEKEILKITPFVSSWANILEVKKRYLLYQFKDIFYKLSTKISTWIGDTKIKKRDPDYYNGQTLINIEKAKLMEAKVLPGDIMLSRTNWFLSNAFLPGFWPHSFIYLGNKEKLTSYFKTPELSEYFLKRCNRENLKCNNMAGYLERAPKTKAAWLDYQIKDKYGFDKVLLEATSDGVSYASIRHTFLNDYLSALRPKLSKLDKAKSIVDALEFHGLEYDFDFDYHTDDRHVCSEIVGKAFAKNAKKGGFTMQYDTDSAKYLELITGRLALPVINFIHKAYDENVLGVRESEFEFVAFLKGIRKENTAKFSTESEFYESRNWKKWSFMRE